MKILGLSAFYHDSAACILDGDRIAAAAQEERFSRRRFDPAFPEGALAWCLEEAGCGLGDVDLVVFHEKPLAKFGRLLATYAAFAPRGFWSFRMAMAEWLGGKMFHRRLITRRLRALDPAARRLPPLLFAGHHESHAASAFYPSPFEEALVVTIDGVGEWATTSVFLGTGDRLDPIKEIRFPHSLGLLYAAVTRYLGFRILSGEYKVMGLAPYGTPRFRDTMLNRLIRLEEDGSFALDQRYFDYAAGERMFSDAFVALFGRPPRRPELDPLEPFHMDIAASIQAVVEEAILRMIRRLVAETGRRTLCLAGGVALNSVAIGHLLSQGIVDRLWVQPAAGDAGAALGAALAARHRHLGLPRVVNPRDSMSGSLLGPGWSDEVVACRLAAAGAVFDFLDEDGAIDAAVAGIAVGKAVGWFQGRMEFGPRALGARSILADARSPAMQAKLNAKVKNRESFRPFAPSVLAEEAADWFEITGESPYMTVVAKLREERRRSVPLDLEANDPKGRLAAMRSDVPAVTHVDHSARLQTVDPDRNPRFHRLLSRFHDATDCPIVVNTSFNVRGEPIVRTPEDAFRCFMGTDIDVLVAGRCVLAKDRQDPALARRYVDDLEPD